jgi:hypothetical protein
VSGLLGLPAIPTMSQINAALRFGHLTVNSAAMRAADRRFLGLCDECPNPMDRDPESADHLCRECYRLLDAVTVGARTFLACGCEEVNGWRVVACEDHPERTEPRA